MLGIVKSFKDRGRKFRAGHAESKAQIQRIDEPGPRGDLAVAKAAQRQGKLSIAGRFVPERSFESDIALDGRVVGTGMSGEVRLARYAGTEQVCTVKTLSKTGLSEARTAEVTSEVEIFLSVDHPNVVRLERLYESEECLRFVMEFLQGGELFSAVENQHFSEARAAEVFRQMLLAVSYLHERKIVHCDLKLENFMFEREGCDHLKLIDFGLAKRYTGEPIPQCCGSLHYVAPEVINCAFDTKADMWSLGVTLYVLLCGAMPWRGDDEEVSRRIRAGEPYFHPPLWQRLSAGAQYLIEGLLAADPAQRLSAQDALRHPWISMRKGARALVVDRAVARSVGDFSRLPALQRACLSMAVWSLPLQEVESLRRQFYVLDVDCNGVISLKDFKQALGSCKQGTRDVDDVELFKSLDINKDGEVSYSEFLAAAVYSRRRRLGDDMLQLTFDRFDYRANGSLSLDNFFDALVDSVSGQGFDLIEGLESIVDGSLSLHGFRSFVRGVDKEVEISDEETCAGTECPDASDDGLSEASGELMMSEFGGEALLGARVRRRVGPSVGCYSQVLSLLRQARGGLGPPAAKSSSRSRGSLDPGYHGSVRSHLGPAILGM